MNDSLSVTPAVERIARVLAGLRLSANAEGEAQSAAIDVEMEWHELIAEAVAILKAIREPDRAMAEAGDSAAWGRMIAIAIDQATRYE
jgi:hypothetical protein